VTDKVATAPHRFIAVEGPIGVGKTSLARRLARSFGSELVLEQADENPFLERFYRNPRSAALQTQLFFLFQRTRQLEDIRQHDLFETVRVADYLLDKDRLFAQLTLDEEELALYEQVYLEKLQEAYARFFHDYHASPLLIVNAAQADYVSNEGDYNQLLEQVRRIRRGRQYYNPLKSAV